jgi:hypothetical protein
MDLIAAFNLCEAIWWLGMTIVCLWQARGSGIVVARTAAILLLFFAASDLIEIRTGAWWRPWWLAVLKGCCLGGLAACGWMAWKVRTRGQR